MYLPNYICDREGHEGRTLGIERKNGEMRGGPLGIEMKDEGWGDEESHTGN